VGLSYDHSFISFFCWFMGEPFWSCNFFFINLPLKLFNFNFIWFFPKKKFLILNLEEKNVAGQERKKNIPTWHFEENKLFQHFANLIKIRSTHLLPIFYTSDPKNREKIGSKCVDLIIPRCPKGVYCFTPVCLSVRPSVLPRYFSQQLDSRNLIFGRKFHTGTPYRGKCFWTCLIPTSCLPT
jgi:hypothetical protein